jgi:ADP-ribose pyrophosphatase YjhB (NUDIX family)
VELGTAGGLVDNDEDPAAAAVRELEDQTDSEWLVFVGRDPEHVGEPAGSDEKEMRDD